MRHLAFTLVLVACAIFGGRPLIARDEKKVEAKAGPSERDQVVAFLKKNVIGKTMAMPKTTFKFDDKKIEVVGEEQDTFQNLVETADGFSYDVTAVVKSMVYDINEEGKRVGPGRDFSGAGVSRAEIAERASTKKLTGIGRTLSTTVKGPSPEGIVTLIKDVRVVDGKLLLSATLPGYEDFPASKGTFKPASFDEKSTLSVVDGKLRFEDDITFFDVDPDTLQRTPAKDKRLHVVADEIEQK
jgi:hypothetical protein